MKKLIVIFVLLLASNITLAATASNTSAPWYQRAQLSGDWGGQRTALEDVGIAAFIVYDAIAASNVSGGIESDQKYTAQLYAGFDIDLDTWLNLSDTIFKFSVVHRHGNSIGQSVGGIYDPMTLYGGQTHYLYELWLEKTLSDRWAFKFGRLSADQDFASSPLYAYSLSTAINGPIRALLLENAITSFPYPVWGGRVKYKPSAQHQLQLGAYQIGDKMWDFREHGTNFRMRSEDGVSVLLQYDWTPEVYGRPARVYVGAVNAVFDFDRFDGSGTSDDFQRYYAHADIAFTEALRVFGLLTWSDEDQVAVTPFQTSFGAEYQGLIASRPNDRSFVYMTYGRFSDEFSLSLSEDRDFEAVYEFGHRFQIAPAFYLQPSVQYIQQPGGTGNIDDAVVIGVWMGATF